MSAVWCCVPRADLGDHRGQTPAQSLDSKQEFVFVTSKRQFLKCCTVWLFTHPSSFPLSSTAQSPTSRLEPTEVNLSFATNNLPLLLNSNHILLIFCCQVMPPAEKTPPPSDVRWQRASRSRRLTVQSTSSIKSVDINTDI